MRALVIWAAVTIVMAAVSPAQRHTAAGFPAPAAKPETIGAADNFPFVPPLPATVLRETRVVRGPLEFNAGTADTETVLVGTAYVQKDYSPATISKAAFLVAYRDGFIDSGWKIASMTRVGDAPLAPGVVTLSASYAANGRLIYAVLADDDEGNYWVRVSDVGEEDWSATLDSACHLPVYGIDFDVNKATLRPDSAPILDKLAAVLIAKNSWSVEVQGHTDNQGDDSVPPSVSAARARAVAAWLIGHGVPASKLSAKGYGKTRPVMDNDSDLGRSRNRRIEVVRVGCRYTFPADFRQVEVG